MSHERGPHARLRKRDSELTTMSTPSYAGEYIDKVAEKYSGLQDKSDDRGKQSFDDRRSSRQRYPTSNHVNNDFEEKGQYVDFSQNNNEPEGNFDMGSQYYESQEIDKGNDVPKKVGFQQASFLEKDIDKMEDYKYQEKVNWEEVRGKMVQSAETIPHFNMDRFDRHWKKFVDDRKSEEHSATLDRRSLRAKQKKNADDSDVERATYSDENELSTDSSEDSADENSSEDEDGSDEKKPKVEKLRSRAIPIGGKRREFYRNMEAYVRQDTVQSSTDIHDNIQNKELLKNVADTKAKSSSPNSLSFWKRLVPWNSIIWNVQATYGPTVANYFMMLRSTMFLNLLNATLICLLVITPQIFDSKDPSHGRNETVQQSCNTSRMFWNDTTWYPETEIGDCCSLDYDANITQLELKLEEMYDMKNGSALEAIQNGFLDFLQGTGFLYISPMFYGYFSGTYSFDFKAVTYKFPLAYFLVMFMIFFVNLVFLVKSFSKFAETESSELSQAPLSELIYSTWDYRTNADDMAKVMKKDISVKVKVQLAKLSRVIQRDERTSGDKRIELAKRVIFWLVWAFVTGGVLYGIWEIGLEKSDLYEKHCTANQEDGFFTTGRIECFMIQYSQSIVLTAVNTILPAVFTKMIVYEGYDPSQELFINLFRCVFIRLASLVITAIVLLTPVTCNYGAACLESGELKFCEKEPPLDKSKIYRTCSNVNITNEERFNVWEEGNKLCEKSLCWETVLGQEFYQLTVLDFGVQLFLVFFWIVPKKLILGYGCFGEKLKGFAEMQFDISKHLLDIVYSQTICWFALFFAPLISAVTMLKMFLIFYLRLFFVKKCCTPAKIPYSASRALSIFKGILFLAFAVASILVVCYIGLGSSKGCGPFREFKCNFGEGTNLTELNELSLVRTWKDDCSAYDYIEYLIYQGELGGPEIWRQVLLALYGDIYFASIVIGIIIAIMVYFVAARAIAENTLLKETQSDLARLKKENAEQWMKLHENMKKIGKELANS